MSVSHKEDASAERIAVITTSYPSDGDDAAGHFVRSEVERARAGGHAITVFAPRARRTNGHAITVFAPRARRTNGHADPVFAPREGREHQSNSAHIVDMPHLGAFGTPGAMTRLRWRPDRWLGAILFVVTARWALRKHGPFDRCVAHFLVPGYWPICSDLGVPLEVVVHGSDLKLFEALPSVLRRAIARGLGSGRRSIRCVSADLARRLVKQLGPDHPCIDVAPSPIDIPELPSKQTLRSELGIGDETLVVIASRLVKSKRVDVALQTATAMPGATVVVCGAGPESKRLHERFPSARFLGQLPRRRVLEWIAASDLVVSASRDEGAPTVVREARALGTPVVAAAAGDLLEWARSDPGIRVVL